MEESAGIAIPNINATKLSALSLSLPPLAEQKRIVAKVEELLARVNAAREHLARVPAILKRFRQSVLAAACSGRLTEDWRSKRPLGEREELRRQAILAEWLKCHSGGEKEGTSASRKRAEDRVSRGPIALAVDDLPDLPEGWIWVSLDQLIASGPQNGLYKPASAYGAGVPIIRIENYQDDFVQPREILSKLKLTQDEVNVYGVRPGDLLVNRVNSPSHLGKCMVVPEPMCPAVFESNIMRIHPTSAAEPEWLHLHLCSMEGRSRLTAEAKWAVNQASINQTDVRTTPVPLPPIDEQREAILRANALFAAIASIEKRMATAIGRTEKVTQATLAKAVRGELVPTEADLARAEGRPYEPSSALISRSRDPKAMQFSRRHVVGSARTAGGQRGRLS